MAEDQDQNRNEAATPFKLEKARAKGSVARGLDLSFFASLLAFAGFIGLAGHVLVTQLSQMMRHVLATGIPGAADPRVALDLSATAWRPALHSVLLLGGTIVAIVLLVEIIQLRGFIFSAQPLKPDFTRINPAKGLKRLFSMRILKEALKSIVKLAIYATVTWLIIRAAITDRGIAIVDAASLVDALRASGVRLLWTFVLVAFGIAVIDQVMARKEFAKQMRMSRREVTREGREREGDPRLKRKRKQLHAEFVKRSKGLGALAGSDMLVVNPEHVAVALKYDRDTGAAPVVVTKARDLHALMMKRQAYRLGIPVFPIPALARALYADHEAGAEIGEAHYHAVAALYVTLNPVNATSAPESR